jgi:hypothetical protein
MDTTRVLAVAAFAVAIAVTTASAQTQRVRGVIQKVDGNTLLIRSSGGDDVTLTLSDDALVVGVVRAAITDIKEGAYIGSGALPQPDGTQKAVEVHIFAERQRGAGEGHRAWDGAPGGTMTNGAVGQTVSSVNGPVITVKYRDGEKKLTVGPSVPIVRYEIGDRSELKPGAAVSILAATRKPDGTFAAPRINVGRDGLVPM